jgi:mRNA-degrading endonuclease RelE of RelBE toxin-antitoxin system
VLPLKQSYPHWGLSILANLGCSHRSIVFGELECENPFDFGYREKMKGYPGQYKIRVGDYRVEITVDRLAKTIICQEIDQKISSVCSSLVDFLRSMGGFY